MTPPGRPLSIPIQHVALLAYRSIQRTIPSLARNKPELLDCRRRIECPPAVCRQGYCSTRGRRRSRTRSISRKGKATRGRRRSRIERVEGGAQGHEGGRRSRRGSQDARPSESDPHLHRRHHLEITLTNRFPHRRSRTRKISRAWTFHRPRRTPLVLQHLRHQSQPRES